MTRHKHADVLIAIAEGKDVEFFDGHSKVWCVPQLFNPLSYPEYEWRVKKEPVITNEFYVSDRCGYVKAPLGCGYDLKITYQDGKPIKAELPA